MVQEPSRSKTTKNHRHRNHRIEDRHIRLYTSGNNTDFEQIEHDSYTLEKNSEGKITILLNGVIETRYIKVHIILDDRDNYFDPTDRAEFINKLANSLQIYQESDKVKEEYVYDRNGNRIRKDVTYEQIFRSEPLYYKNSEWLLTDGKYAYKYDAAGNTTDKGSHIEIEGLVYAVNSKEAQSFLEGIAADRTLEPSLDFVTEGEEVEYWQYTFDALNRLIEVNHNDNSVAEYEYGPDSLRTVSRENGVTTHQIYSGNDLIFEKETGTEAVTRYVVGFGGYVARVDGDFGDEEAERYWFSTDHIGSVRAMTDGTGVVVWEAEYSPFGEQLIEQDRVYAQDSSGVSNKIRFAGKSWSETILAYYMNARYYSPETGRFLSEDPVFDGANWYNYAANNPIMFTDPTGLFASEGWMASYQAPSNTSHDDIVENVQRLDIKRSALELDIRKNDELKRSNDLTYKTTDSMSDQELAIMAGVDNGIRDKIKELGKEYSSVLEKNGNGKSLTMEEAALLNKYLFEVERLELFRSSFLTKEYNQFMFGQAASTYLHIIPGVGTIKRFTEVLTGKEWISGYKFSVEERVKMGVHLVGEIALISTLIYNNAKYMSGPSRNSGASPKPFSADSNTPNGARTWQEAGMSKANATRIQNAANKTGQRIDVVGSRAGGTASATSDWDYILYGNSAQRHSAANSLPRGTAGGEIYKPGIDLLQSFNNTLRSYTVLDTTKAHIIFYPMK